MIDLDALKKIGAANPLDREKGRYQLPPVSRSRELDRILALPRHEGYSAEARAELQTALARPEGKMRLKEAQANALLAALEGGPDGCAVVGALPVGEGKTLLAALLPTVLERPRALILTSASLLPQLRALIDEYRAHFYIRDDLLFESYAILSRPESTDLLSRLAPTLIIADEAHALRNAQSARGKRFWRFMAKEAGALFCPLSGTLTKKSILDQAPMLRRALRDWAPVPRDYPTLKEWAEALDPDGVRPPGALMQLPGDAGDDARTRYARRLRETRGVIVPQGEALGASLVIEVLEPPPSPAIDAARAELARTWARPDGAELTTALEIAEVDRQLRLGGSYVWERPPDVAWLRARTTATRATREWLRNHNREGCDSPALLADAVLDGREDVPEIAAWYTGRFDQILPPPKVWRWIDDGAHANWIASLVRTDPPCVCFCGVVAVGKHIAQVARAPYYGEGPAAARAVLDERGTRSIVCSLDAHHKGRNFQAWSRAVVVDFPPSADTAEQLLGRLHRFGQDADEVRFQCFSTHGAELLAAINGARFLGATTGQQQKLEIASVLWPAST